MNLGPRAKTLTVTVAAVVVIAVAGVLVNRPYVQVDSDHVRSHGQAIVDVRMTGDSHRGVSGVTLRVKRYSSTDKKTHVDNYITATLRQVSGDCRLQNSFLDSKASCGNLSAGGQINTRLQYDLPFGWWCTRAYIDVSTDGWGVNTNSTHFSECFDSSRPVRSTGPSAAAGLQADVRRAPRLRARTAPEPVAALA